MSHRVLGTAGHIDHGKTALIRALTGVNTDRLPEEKRRGITIELGFAPLDLGDGEVVGVVDVPGHERFVRTMLAGAGGIDAVLLVVAADESIKPQTREHFDICRLLGVQGGVVALTKIDLVEEELREVVREEIAEYLAGSFLSGAPVVPVSVVSGEGLEDLRRTLAECIRALPAPQRHDFARLPVDRIFTMKGFGSVVTGTLLSGRIRAGDALSVWPVGGSVRARRVQVHGREVEEASSGQRTALNVVGQDKTSPVRGDLLATPGRMAASSLLDVHLELLPGAAKGIGNQSRLRFFLGTAEGDARVRLLGGEKLLSPGRSAYAQLRLSSPIAATVGDRFVVRRASPARTLGGGQVIDPAPSKHRRGDSGVVERLRQLAEGDAEERLAGLLDEAAEAGLRLSDLVVRTGLSPARIDAAVARLEKSDRCLTDGAAGGAVMAGGARDARIAHMLSILELYHERRPLDAGMSLQELRQRAAPRTPDSLVQALLKHATAAGIIRIEGQRVAAGAHSVSLDSGEEALLSGVESEVKGGGLDPPDPLELLAGRGLPRPRAVALVRLLQERGTLVRIGSGYHLHREVLDDLKRRLWQQRETEPLIEVGQFKKLAGVTRRRAIPLLEYLDAEHVTTRRGDRRFIQPPAAREG